jgi:hypothetical protein
MDGWHSAGSACCARLTPRPTPATSLGGGSATTSILSWPWCAGSSRGSQDRFPPFWEPGHSSCPTARLPGQACSWVYLVVTGHRCPSHHPAPRPCIEKVSTLPLQIGPVHTPVLGAPAVEELLLAPPAPSLPPPISPGGGTVALWFK